MQRTASLDGRAMLTSDKLTLRNLVLAMIAGSALALAVGLRWAALRPPIPVVEERSAGVPVSAAAMTIAPVTRTPERDSVRSSAGGVPFSTTTLSSAEWDAGSPANTDTSAGAAPSAPRIFQQAPPAAVPGRVRTLTEALDASPPPPAAVPASAPAPVETAPPPATGRGDASVDAAPAAAAAAPSATASAPTPAPEATMGAGKFMTDWPSPWP